MAAKWWPKYNRLDASKLDANQDNFTKFVKELKASVEFKDAVSDLWELKAEVTESIVKKFWLTQWLNDTSLLQEYSTAFQATIQNLKSHSKHFWLSESEEGISVLHVDDSMDLGQLELQIDPLLWFYDTQVEDWAINLLNEQWAIKFIIAIDSTQEVNESLDVKIDKIESTNLTQVGNTISQLESTIESVDNTTPQATLEKLWSKIEWFNWIFMKFDIAIITKLIPDMGPRLTSMYQSLINKISYFKQNYEILTLSWDPLWSTAWMWNFPIFARKKRGDNYERFRNQEKLQQLLDASKQKPLVDMTGNEIEQEKVEATLEKLKTLKRQGANFSIQMRTLLIDLKIEHPWVRKKIIKMVNQEIKQQRESRLDEVKSFENKTQQQIFYSVKEIAKIKFWLDLYLTNEQLAKLEIIKITSTKEITPEQQMENVWNMLSIIKDDYPDLSLKEHNQLLDVFFQKEVVWPYAKEFLSTTDSTKPFTWRVVSWLIERRAYWSAKWYALPLTWAVWSWTVWAKIENIVQSTTDSMVELSDHIHAQTSQVAESSNTDISLDNVEGWIDSAQEIVTQVADVHQILKEIWEMGWWLWRTGLDAITNWKYSELMRMMENLDWTYEQSSKALNDALTLLNSISWTTNWLDWAFTQFSSIMESINTAVHWTFDASQVLSLITLAWASTMMHWYYNSWKVDQKKYKKSLYTWFIIWWFMTVLYFMIGHGQLTDLETGILQQLDSIKDMMQFYWTKE